MTNIETLVKNQRDYFYSQETLPITFRIEQLKKLETQIKKYEKEILLALKLDLNKSYFESYAAEIALVYEELHFMIKNIKKLAKPKKCKTPLMHFPSKTYTHYDPYGCVLIMSPWNYPFQLAMIPLIGAIASGNCVLVKPSNYSKETSKVIKNILQAFNTNYINTVEGGRDVNTELLNQKFNYIFFTGSPMVGQLVMEKAAKNLIPFTLELGGKSPCIVHKDAKIDLAAKRIAWGKLLNSGQTCIAPDYILAHKDIKEDLINGIQKYIKEFYGNIPHANIEYPKIITENHFNRLSELIEESKKEKGTHVLGGKTNANTQQIEPTILDNASWCSKIMEDEIFGPILPIIGYTEIADVITQINARQKPLALYLFTQSKDVEQKVIKTAYYGGGCINDTMVHVANHHAPFGGVGNSGMGKYHGKESFATFSHTKTILKKSSIIDIKFRYAPYGNKFTILKRILK